MLFKFLCIVARVKKIPTVDWVRGKMVVSVRVDMRFLHCVLHKPFSFT